jgi:hypothetical protein
VCRGPPAWQAPAWQAPAGQARHRQAAAVSVLLRRGRRRRCRWRAGPRRPGPVMAERIVVLGSAWEAASWTSRSGTLRDPASRAAVMNACLSVCGPTGHGLPGVVKEVFLDGVLVEPAMVYSRRVTVARARPLASRSRAKHSMSGRRAWNKRMLRCWRRSDWWRGGERGLGTDSARAACDAGLPADGPGRHRRARESNGGAVIARLRSVVASQAAVGGAPGWRTWRGLRGAVRTFAATAGQPATGKVVAWGPWRCRRVTSGVMAMVMTSLAWEH